MIVALHKKRKWQKFKFLKPPSHDCWFIRLGPFRVRIGDGGWLHGGDFEAIASEEK